MTEDQFRELVAAGERPGVEFKNARARGDANFWEVVRAVLGMANRRDGGLILVGVEDNGNVQGLTEAQRLSWEPADHVRQAISPYADPFAFVDVEVVDLAQDGAVLRCAVLKVEPFETVPVLCAKPATAHGQEVLRQGACYVRSRQMPSTEEISDHASFRELLDIAIDRGIRDFLRRARAAGIQIDVPVAPSDEELFRAQREEPGDE